MASDADSQPRAQSWSTNGTSAGACADVSVVTALLAGQLSSEEHARVEAHVSHCPLCQEHLKELDESPAETGTNAFLNVLRSVATEYQAEDAPTFHRVVEQLKAGRIEPG